MGVTKVVAVSGRRPLFGRLELAAGLCYNRVAGPLMQTVLPGRQLLDAIQRRSRRGEIGTITVKLPEDVATQLEAERVSQEQLNTFLVAALEAWLRRRQRVNEAHRGIDKRPWSEAFQDSAVDFVDELIDENRLLFEELARL